MKSPILVALCIIASVLANSDWTVVCDTANSDCPDFAFDALVRGDGRVVVAGGKGNVEGAPNQGFHVYDPATNTWDLIPVRNSVLFGMDYDMYSWDVVATGSSDDDGASVHVLHTNSSAVTSTLAGAQLSRPGCSYVEKPLSCILGGSNHAQRSQKKIYMADSEDALSSWSQTDINVAPTGLPVTTAIPFMRTNFYVRSQFPYSEEAAHADADADCVRLSESRCLKTQSAFQGPTRYFNLARTTAVNDAHLQVINHNKETPTSPSLSFETRAGQSEVVPEGFHISSLSCGIFQAQRRFCFAVGEAIGGKRGVWMGSMDNSNWVVITNENAHIATPEYSAAVNGNDGSPLRAGESPFIKELHSVTYALEKRTFYAVGTIIDDNGASRPALLSTVNGGMKWDEEILPAEAKNAGELTNVRVTVVGGCGYITVLGRNVEGGKTFVAHKKVIPSCY